MSNTTPPARSYERRDRRPYPGAIRQFLTERGMTQTDLADAIGYDRKTVAKALRGDLVTWAFANEVAHALNVRMEAIADPDPAPDPEVVT